MKHGVSVPAAALCAALLLTGCGGTAAASSAAAPSAVSSRADSGKAVSSQAPSSAAAASSQAAAGSKAETAGPGTGSEGMVDTISTDSEAFNKKFKSNPIDIRYASEMGTTMTTRDIVTLASQYADVWNKEIDHAYAELKKVLSTDSTMKWKQIEAGQKTWEDGKNDALNQIGKDAQAGGGSVAQVVTSSKTMEFYRKRAAELYRILYDYEPGYTYAYAG